MMYAHTKRWPTHPGEYGIPEGYTCTKCGAGVNAHKVEFHFAIRVASCLVCGHAVSCRVIIHADNSRAQTQRTIKEQDCASCGAVFKTHKERYCPKCKNPRMRHVRQREDSPT